ncbi:MAG TPA: recombinase family protein [Planctomycetota bacterium]|nr:recombinase family protein [Planctomycetota bacterium]
MRAAIYARYSSDLQREASIEDQVRVCRRRIEREGWSRAQVYSDHASSGASHLRPGYQKLLEDARDGRFDVVVAESLDRLSRDQEHVAALYKLLSFRGIPLVTVAEGEVSELHVGLKGTMGALYLKDLAQKTRRGLEGRVRQGLSGGGLCYGYDVAGRTGERTVNDAQARVVRRVFREFAAGSSPRAIAAGLNRDGIPGPRGTAWGASTIYGNWRRGTGILNNELYVGRLVWNRQRFIKDPETGRRQARPNPPEEWVIEEVPELRIVDDDLWAQAKARQKATRSVVVEKSSVRSERARRPVYLFSGLLGCGACGGGYVLVGARHYGCANARNRGTCTNRLTIRRDVLEATVLDGLREHLMHPDLVAEYVAEYQREWNRLRAETLGARAGVETELKTVEKQIRNIVEAVKAGFFAPAMKEEMAALEARQTELRARMEEAPAEPAIALHPGLVEVYRRRVGELSVSLNDPALRQEAAEALRGLVERIVLLPVDGALQIELVGELAGILALGKGKRPGFGGRGVRQTTLVAGAGFGQDPTQNELAIAC